VDLPLHEHGSPCADVVDDGVAHDRTTRFLVDLDSQICDRWET